MRRPDSPDGFPGIVAGDADPRAGGEDAPPDACLRMAGLAFSACVLILGIWDHVANGAQDQASLALRLALVLLGMPGYAWRTSAWAVLPRWMLLYVTHSLALVANAVSPAHGLVQAMPALVMSVLVAGLVETRPRRCMAILLPPVLLHAAAGALTLPRRVWLASLAAWAIAIPMAALISAANGAMRQARRRREQLLLDACRFDSLSGAMTRAYVTELGRRDVSLARRHARPLAIAMLDIDHFKRVNDSHGHAVGDAVIRALAEACRTSLRRNDYVGRCGGEEFVCVMPETAAAEALACAERIRASFERMRLPSPSGPVQATVSVGVAVLCGNCEWEGLLREADAALYHAKNGGRNRSILAAHHDCALPA